MKLIENYIPETIATESINFQNKDFFNALVAQINKVRENKEIAKLDTEVFFKTKEIEDLCKVVKKYTNILIVLEEGGPAIYTPEIRGNHIFNDKEFIAWLKEINRNDLVEGQIKDILKKIKKQKVNARVDLVHGKVSGAYAEIELRMLMLKEMYVAHSKFLAEEVAAIMLHEIGHAFTYYEFVERGVTTNQSLALLTTVLDSRNVTNKEFVFAEYSKTFDLDSEKTDALKKCKDAYTMNLIILDQIIEESVSELGKSLYDVNSCEYLADQFATRFGAGKYVVTGLDKLRDWYRVIPFHLMIINCIVNVFAYVTLLPVAPLWLYLLIVTPDKKDEIYDNMHARINRIRLQNVEQLKDKALSNEIKTILLNEISDIDLVLSKYKDELNFSEKLAYVFRPGYRAAHKYEKLQKDLERIAGNDLFLLSAKLKTI